MWPKFGYSVVSIREVQFSYNFNFNKYLTRKTGFLEGLSSNMYISMVQNHKFGAGTGYDLEITSDANIKRKSRKIPAWNFSKTFVKDNFQKIQGSCNNSQSRFNCFRESYKNVGANWIFQDELWNYILKFWTFSTIISRKIY